MPRSLVVDSHVHFWNPGLLFYPWLAEFDALRRPYLPGDYEPFDTGDVDAVLFVQADCLPEQSIAEVEFVELLADQDPRIVGIVAFVDLLGEAARSAAFERLARSRRVVGVRHNVQGHQPGYALDPRFVDGVREVGAHGYPFDLCVTASQLSEVTELVERCPDVRFVLDHCGKPAIRDDAYETWAREIALLAAHDRVSCKLSGLLTEARADQRHLGALRPYLARAVECFGPERVLYGTDWPVAVLGGGAPHWREIVDSFARDWNASDRERLFGGNAASVYGLEVHASR